MSARSAAHRGPAWQAAAGVVDPEIRAVTVEDLGILRDVAVDEATGRVTVTITPTYTACPAMDVIRADITAAVRAAGYADVRVVTQWAQAWSTDWISASGRAKLSAAGIAPPGPAIPPGPATSTGSAGAAGPVPLRLAVRCPLCGSPDTEELSRFGSTACKSLWRCRACAEPFDHFKAL